MKTNSTRVVMVLDRSGSMHSIRNATIEGFNEFLGTLKAGPGDISMKLVIFDHEYETVFDVPIKQAPMLTLETLVPRGSTALLDAQGRTIDELGMELRGKSPSDRPEKVVMVTVTDGIENASRFYTAQQIARMIEHQRAVYSWEFAYLGANQDAVAVANTMRVRPSQALTFSSSDEGMKASMSILASKLHGISAGTLFHLDFTEEDRCAAIGEEAIDKDAPHEVQPQA